jgi:Kef-type K+ transport system membrane component KefB
LEHSLFSLGLLLITAKLLEGIAIRLRQSSLVAYVAAGLILGPVLKVVEPSDELTVFFGIGVLFMFFLIGIQEMDISGLVATLRGRFFYAGLIAFAIPFGISLAVLITVLDMLLPNAIALAGVISLSSLGVVARVLSDLGYLKKPLGLQVFTTVVVVEVIGLLVVSLSLEEVGRSGGFSPGRVPLLLLEITAFAVGAWFVASRVFPPLVVRLRQVLGVPQLTLGLIIGGLFLVVAGVDKIGMHGSLGALLLGVALSGLPSRLRMEILPGMQGLAAGLFIPLFFASAGLYLTLSFTELPTIYIISLVLAAIFGKFVGSIMAVRIARLERPLAFATGLMGKGVVEIALLLVMLDREAISPQLFSLLILIMLCFIFLVPPALGAAIRSTKASENPTSPKFVVPSFARHAFETVVVKEIMEESQRFPTADLSVQKFLDYWVVPDQQDYVVVSEPDRLAGVVSLREITHLPKNWRKDMPISNYMQENPPVAVPDEHLDDVLGRMAEHNLSIIPVVDPLTGKLLGSVTSNAVLALMMGVKEAGAR